jgi:hypothetical protein
MSTATHHVPVPDVAEADIWQDDTAMPSRVLYGGAVASPAANDVHRANHGGAVRGRPASQGGAS